MIIAINELLKPGCQTIDLFLWILLDLDRSIAKAESGRRLTLTE
jgi:hypothetical protein